MSNEKVLNIDEVLNIIFESLANPVRRKILEVLDNEGPLPYTELMRRCGIRDSRTLKHHLEKLGPLVAKNRGGTYVVTKLGSRVLRFVELLKDELIDVIIFTRMPKPLIIFKPSVRHYLVLTATSLIALGLMISLLGPTYLAIIPVALVLSSLIAAGIRKSKVVIVGSNLIIESHTTPISTSKKVIRCTVLGAEVVTNALLKVFGLVRVSLITDTGTSLRTYTLGVTTASKALSYVKLINELLESSEIRARFNLGNTNK